MPSETNNSYYYLARGPNGPGFYQSVNVVDEGLGIFYGTTEPVYAYFTQGVDGAGYYVTVTTVTRMVPVFIMGLMSLRMRSLI